MVIIKDRKEHLRLAPIALVVIFSVLMLLLGFVYLADTQSTEINMTDKLLKPLQNLFN